MFGMVPFRRRQMAPRRDDFFSMPVPEWVQNFMGLPDWPSGFCRFNVDVRESKDSYIFQAELPGVDKNDIHVNVDNQYLTIAINSDQIKEENNQDYIHKERRTINSQRSFFVGNVDASKINAKYANGILEIVVPKPQDGSGGRQIPIH